MNDRMARVTDPQTSHMGAADVRIRAHSQREKLLLAYYYNDRPEGLTPTEARKLAGISLASCYWKRISDLHNIHGYLDAVGERVSDDTGSFQTTYRINEKGRQAVVL